MNKEAFIRGYMHKAAEIIPETLEEADMLAASDKADKAEDKKRTKIELAELAQTMAKLRALKKEKELSLIKNGSRYV